MIRAILAVIVPLLLPIGAKAQTFDQYFDDMTLRIDYTFAGNAAKQDIALDELVAEPRWWGKRQRLTELPVEGNGQIIVRNHRSRRVIYRNSFSTLFQEWLSYDEAKGALRRSFENVFLVPMPKDTADITVELRDNRHQVTCSFTHQVAPRDILIRRLGFDHVTPYVTLQRAADTTRCIHIAYIAEGYRQNEMEAFIADARRATEALFRHEPFTAMRDRFNIVAVEAPSQESGTSEPSRGLWRHTALSSHFNTFYSERYLTTLHLKDLHDWLAGIPYEHIIVLVNTDHYGGGGILNSYNLSMTRHRLFEPVVVHEFGHSFAGLGDEYAYEDEAIPMYPHDVEPWEPNLTTLKDFHGKWEDMIARGTPIPTPMPKHDSANGKKHKKKLQNATLDRQIGVYEGAGYSLHGVYRGAPDCRMRTNENPVFCPVCRRAITRLIDFYTR